MREIKKFTAEDYHNIILELTYSLSLADHLGDVGDSIISVLRSIGEEEIADADWEYYKKGTDEDGYDEYTSELHELLEKKGIN